MGRAYRPLWPFVVSRSPGDDPWSRSKSIIKRRQQGCGRTVHKGHSGGHLVTTLIGWKTSYFVLGERCAPAAPGRKKKGEEEQSVSLVAKQSHHLTYSARTTGQRIPQSIKQKAEKDSPNLNLLHCINSNLSHRCSRRPKGATHARLREKQQWRRLDKSNKGQTRTLPATFLSFSSDQHMIRLFIYF